jgi:sensor histidine kinase regulating citrate/malate metabolism
MKPAAGLCLLIFTAGSLLTFKGACRNNLYREWWSLFKIFRQHRHDFQNHLQIIYGFIQLKKYDRVLDYIRDLKKADETLSRICALTDPGMMCFLLELISSLRQKGVDVSVEISEDFDANSVNMANVRKQIDNYMVGFGENEGIKDIKIVLNGSNVQICSSAMGENVNIRKKRQMSVCSK